MTPAERRELREKHHPYRDKRWVEWCGWCGHEYRCDTIKVLDYLDTVEPIDNINWSGGK